MSAAKSYFSPPNLFGPKYSSYVVSHIVAPACANNCVALPLSILVGAGETHAGGDDAIGLQNVHHFGELLQGERQIH